LNTKLPTPPLSTYSSQPDFNPFEAPNFSETESEVGDSHNIASMDIQGNIGDASDLQSGGGVAGAMAKLYKGKLSRNDNDEKNVEGITAKTVRPEGSICELSSDIPPNWKDI